MDTTNRIHNPYKILLVMLSFLIFLIFVMFIQQILKLLSELYGWNCTEHIRTHTSKLVYQHTRMPSLNNHIVSTSGRAEFGDLRTYWAQRSNSTFRKYWTRAH